MTRPHPRRRYACAGASSRLCSAAALLVLMAGCAIVAPDEQVAPPDFDEEEGPFRFALDTGASDTTLHLPLAEELGLPVGEGREVTGVTGTGEAREVEVTDWRVGDVPLPPGTLAALPIPAADADEGFEGLLGSDVLSGFGAVTVDYERGILTLRPRED